MNKITQIDLREANNLNHNINLRPHTTAKPGHGKQ